MRGKLLMLLVVLPLLLLNACSSYENAELQSKEQATALEAPDLQKEKQNQEQETITSGKLTTLAWEALNKKEYAKVYAYTGKCILGYGAEAETQQKSLNAFPQGGGEPQYAVLNHVGTALFIKGIALLEEDKIDGAKKAYKTLIEKYSYAQQIDTARMVVWRVAEQFKEKLDIYTGALEETEHEITPAVVSGLKLSLDLLGTETVIDYAQYGEFHNIGTDKYRYKIVDKEGLSKAVGLGIYPNRDIYKSEEYKRLLGEGRLEGKHWDFLNIDDKEASFYKWAAAPEDEGVKLFYIASMLENSGYMVHAIKAYYALIVHFPKAIGWTYWHTPWYVGQAAVDKLYFILRNHPELGMKLLVDAEIKVINRFDDITGNDVIQVNPGKLVKCRPEEVAGKKRILDKEDIEKQIGGEKIKLVKYKSGDWQLLVDGDPYIIKATAYAPTRIGQSPDEGSLEDWTYADENENGKIDGPYEAWVDKNENNKQDDDEPNVGDFQLMKDMGVNTLRIYHHNLNKNKQLLKELYEKYNIMVIMGNFVGAYTVDSGADWASGTDYTDPEQKKNMMDSVKQMVEEYKDEPYVLMWMLGNENNYGVANNAKDNPEAYYSFVNEAAKWIKTVDKKHPIAICNGEVLFLDIIAKLVPNVDIFGVNAYRGAHGFGKSFYTEIEGVYDRPVLITEYGAPAYYGGKPLKFADEKQAEFHAGYWNDIEFNTAGSGIGNCLGGVIFEWLDEWWKAYNPKIHDSKPLFAGAFPDGYMYEEWLGIIGQGDGSNSPFMRRLRKSYYLYKKLWNK